MWPLILRPVLDHEWPTEGSTCLRMPPNVSRGGARDCPGIGPAQGQRYLSWQAHPLPPQESQP